MKKELMAAAVVAFKTLNYYYKEQKISKAPFFSNMTPDFLGSHMEGIFWTNAY
jgi:hypothetical protein